MSKKDEQIEGARFVRYFGPLLDALRALGGSGTPAEVTEQIARDLKIPEEVQSELTEAGQERFPNEVAWARFYLVREGLIDSSRRGVWSLSDKGRATHLNYNQARQIFLKWVKYYAEERRRKAATAEPEEQAPGERVSASSGHRGTLREILATLPASGFEQLCQRLLRESGFVQVVVTGRSGDGGIDGHGTLQVNPLVSFKVLFQCKRVSRSVTASQVRDFRGAMQGRADKGIILTTGAFTLDARREATRDGVTPIELVDGEKLLDMFEEQELGLKPVKAYEVDPAFFDDFNRQGEP